MTDTTVPDRIDTRELFKEMRIVKFSENEDEWPKLSKNFMAVAKVKMFANILDGSVPVPKLTDNMDEKDIAIRDLNQAAYLLLCMAQ